MCAHALASSRARARARSSARTPSRARALARSRAHALTHSHARALARSRARALASPLTPPAHPFLNKQKDSFWLFHIQNNQKDSFCLFNISDLLPTADESRQTAQLASQPFLRLTHKSSHATQGRKSPKTPRDCRKRWQKQEKKKTRKNTLSHSRVFCQKNPQRKSHFFRRFVKSL